MSEPTLMQPKWMTLSGRILSLLPCFALAGSAAMKFQHAPQVVDMMVNKFGYSEGLLPILGTLELVCTLLYAYPATAPWGVILLTGYLGGAVATHTRVADNVAGPLIIGVLLWAGLFLRNPKLRAWLGVKF